MAAALLSADDHFESSSGVAYARIGASKHWEQQDMALLDQGTGVIITPPFADLASGRINLSFEEYDAKLLFFLTYFDRLATAAFNPAFGQGILVCSTELEQHMVEQRLLETVFPARLNQNGEWSAALPAGLAQFAFHGLNQTPEHGQHWALAPVAGLDSEFAGEEIDVLVMTMSRVLPAPLPNTPLVDVLDFKQRHRAELEGLRRGLNELSLTFRGGMTDADVSLLVERKLEGIVGGVRGAFGAWGGRYFTPDLSISWAIPRAAVAAVLEWVAQTQFKAPPGTGAAVASSITFNLGKTRLGREGNGYPKDFSYLLTGMREALLESQPDRPPVGLDMRDVRFADNQCRLVYPPRLIPPSPLVGSEFVENFDLT